MRYSLASTEERSIDFEAGILGRGADQLNPAILYERQEEVLLRLGEAVDLVNEEDCLSASKGLSVKLLRQAIEASPAQQLELVLCLLKHLAHIGCPRTGRTELLEVCVSHAGYEPSEGSLAASRRAPEYA